LVTPRTAANNNNTNSGAKLLQTQSGEGSPGNYNSTHPGALSASQSRSLSSGNGSRKNSTGNLASSNSATGTATSAVANFVSNVAQVITGNYGSNSSNNSASSGARAQSARILRSSSDGKDGSGRQASGTVNTYTSGNSPAGTQHTRNVSYPTVVDGVRVSADGKHIHHHHGGNHADSYNMPVISTSRTQGDDNTPRHLRK